MFHFYFVQKYKNNPINRVYLNRVTKDRSLQDLCRMKSPTKDTEKIYLGKLIDRIVNLRKTRGMSQEKLALESEIARSLMYSYEKKDRNISWANLIRIIKFGFKMTVEEFFSVGFDKEVEKKGEMKKKKK